MSKHLKTFKFSDQKDHGNYLINEIHLYNLNMFKILRWLSCKSKQYVSLCFL